MSYVIGWLVNPFENETSWRGSEHLGVDSTGCCRKSWRRGARIAKGWQRF